MAGGMHGGACMVEGERGREHAWQGVHGRGGMHGRRDGHCSGWYASYWNAFYKYKFVMKEASF